MNLTTDVPIDSFNPINSITVLTLNHFDTIAYGNPHPDQLCKDLQCTDQQLSDFLDSKECQNHLKLGQKLAQFQAQVRAHRHVDNAIETLHQVTNNTRNPMAQRLAATELLAYAGIIPDRPPALILHQTTKTKPPETPTAFNGGADHPPQSAHGANPQLPANHESAHGAEVPINSINSINPINSITPAQPFENKKWKFENRITHYLNILLLFALLLQNALGPRNTPAPLQPNEPPPYSAAVSDTNISSQEPHLIAADAVIPMDPAFPPVMPHAGVVVAGSKILAVGELADLRRQFGELPVQRNPGVLMPGFINAHTHLELSGLAGQLSDAHDFPAWVDALMQKLPGPGTPEHEAFVKTSTRRGAAESLRAGITTLGDITRNPALTRPELLDMAAGGQGPRVVSFGEVVGLGTMRHRLFPMLDAAATPIPQPPQTDPLVAIGISPHAPYTVEGPSLRKIVARAILKKLPLCMHLAELQAERDFLRDLSGPLGRSWSVMQRLNTLDDQIPAFDGGPIRWAQLWALLITDPISPPPRDLPVLLAHVNYCDNAELAQLAASHVSVAYCPRTREFFGHDAVSPHRYRDMLDAGLNVCLATDSLASNPDLSVLKEAQFLNSRDHLPALTALDMITRRAAIALGRRNDLGTLAPEKSADLLLLPVDGAQLAEQLLETIVKTVPLPRAIWLAGRRVV